MLRLLIDCHLRAAILILTLLFLPSFIAYGWPEVDFPPIQGRAVVAADHHPKAGLLQDARVVVVGVSHCPATVVPLSVFVL